MPGNNETTTKFNVDISELKKAMQDAKREIRVANSEFKAVSSSMDKWSESSEGLNAKLKQLGSNEKSQVKILKSLEEQYSQVATEQGENSKGADELRIKINNQKAAISQTQREIKKYEEALGEVNDKSKKTKQDSKAAADGIKDIEQCSDKAEKQASGLGKTLGGALKTGMLAVAAAGATFVTAFLANAEASQDMIEDMGKLETAFVSAGKSVDQAKKSYQGMVGILGESDQAVEAVSHLAKLTKNEEELSKWTDIAAGIYGTFGDSLPLEGLTEASNETAKVGQVTGALADALNWAGISEDSFNDKLAKCNTEKERASLITDTLNMTYKEAADIYKEVNGDLIEAREATSNLNTAMATIGEVALPILTMLKNAGADLLNTFAPAIKEIGAGLTGLMSGLKDDIPIVEGLKKATDVIPDYMQETANDIASGSKVIETETEKSSAKLGGGIQSLFSGLIGKIKDVLPMVLQIGVDIISSISSALIASVPSLIETIIGVVPQLIQAASTLMMEFVSMIKESLPDIVESIALLIIESVPELVDAMMSLIGAIVEALPTIMESVMGVLPELIDTIINYIVTIITEGIPMLLDAAIVFFNAIVDAIPEIITQLTNALPEIINKVTDMLLESLPVILEAAIQLFNALIDAIPVIIKGLQDSLPKIIKTLIKVLLEALPIVLEAAVTLLNALVEAIPVILDALIEALPTILDALMTGLIEAVPQLLEAAITLLMALIDALPVIIEALVTALPDIITTIIESLLDALPMLIEAAITLFMALIHAIPQIVSALIVSLPTIIETIISVLLESLPLLIEAAIDLFMGIVVAIPEVFVALVEYLAEMVTVIIEGVKEVWPKFKEWLGELGENLKESFGEMIENVVEKFKDLPERFKEVGTDTIKGLWEGIQDMTSWIVEKIQGFGDTVLGGIKDFFGIASPSKIMRDEVGKWIPEGIAIGIDKNAKSVLQSMKDLTTKSIAVAREGMNDVSISTGVEGGIASGGTINNFQQIINSPKAVSRLEIYRQTQNVLGYTGGA